MNGSNDLSGGTTPGAYAIVVVACVFFALLLSGCSSAPPQNTVLEGHWETAEGANTPMTAEISGGTMEINWVQDDGYALYWLGSSPVDVLDGDTFTSEGDTEEMAMALLASMDPTKDFTMVDGNIEFELGIMGTVQIITLVKDN